MSCPFKEHIEQADTFAKHLGIRIETAEPGHAVTVLDLDERHKNGVNLAHGGAIFALADLAFAVAANSGQDRAVLNINSSINYMRPGKVGPIKATATNIHSGEHLTTYRVDIHDGNNTLVAVATITGFHTSRPIAGS